MTSEARLLINAVVVPLCTLLPLAVCIFAWIKGGVAERLGSSLFSASVLGTTLAEVLTGQATPVMQELFLDTGVAVGLLVLAIRYNNLWLGAAMIVKGLQLAVHATHLTDGEDPYFLGFNLYAVSLNLISLLICLIMFGGAVATIRQRVRTRQQTRRTSAASLGPESGRVAIHLH